MTNTLAYVHQRLSTHKSRLDAAPYAEVHAGFGDIVVFNSAWGYWLSARIGNEAHYEQMAKVPSTGS